MDHQVVAGLTRDGDGAAGCSGCRVDRPQIRTHQPGASLRFVDGRDAEIAERVDGVAIGALDVPDDCRRHDSLG